MYPMQAGIPRPRRHSSDVDRRGAYRGVTVLDTLPENARVAVIRLRSLGDCVLTTPALAILKKTRPDLRIGVAVESRFEAVVEGNPDVSMLLNPTPSAIFGYKPQLCINLHGGTRSMWMT